MNKEQIRKIKLAKRKNLSTKAITEKSKIINQHLIDFLKKSDYCTIAFYYPFKNEVELWLTCDYCFKQNYRVLFPRIKSNRKMIFQQVTQIENQFKKNHLGIYEPHHSPQTKTIYTEKIDLLLVPGLAFDVHFNRIGYGGGYYDIFLNQLSYSPYKIGVFFSLQKTTTKIAAKPHDLILDKIITEKFTLEVLCNKVDSKNNNKK